MSRVGKKPILIPENVEVKIEGSKVTVKGPRGELQKEVPPEIKVEIHPVKSAKGGAEQFNRVKGEEIFVLPKIETKRTKAFWGTTRVQIANMMKGVAEGFEKKLEIQGLGYKATLETSATGSPDLILSVGFSHPIKIKAPPGIKFSLEKNIIAVSGIDKELVGQIAAQIRKIRLPEPYKGKGIRYIGEVVRKKAGKKVVTAAG